MTARALIHILVALVIFCAVVGLLLWALKAVLAVLPIAEPFMTIIRVSIVLICFLLLLGILFGGIGFPPLRF